MNKSPDEEAAAIDDAYEKFAREWLPVPGSRRTVQEDMDRLFRQVAALQSRVDNIWQLVHEIHMKTVAGAIVDPAEMGMPQMDEAEATYLAEHCE
jgi:hypothetical protein